MFWVGVILLLYVGALIGLTLVSLRPFRIPFWISPGSLGHHQEDVELVTEDDVIIRGWWSENSESKKVAIFLHGYMMNRCELAPEAHALIVRGFSCLLIDFRSHGRSGSAPSSIGYRERFDVKAAVAFVRRRLPDAKIVLIGSSMGSASIAFALAEDPTLADAAVIDSAYDRLYEAISGWWRFLGGKALAAFLYPLPYIAWPINRLNPFEVDVSQALAKVGPKPLLFFHGSRDNLALPTGAERNFASAAGPKRMVWFEGCRHSEGRWMQPDLYHRELFAWLEENGF